MSLYLERKKFRYLGNSWAISSKTLFTWSAEHFLGKFLSGDVSVFLFKYFERWSKNFWHLSEKFEQGVQTASACPWKISEETFPEVFFWKYWKMSKKNSDFLSIILSGLPKHILNYQRNIYPEKRVFWEFFLFFIIVSAFEVEVRYSWCKIKAGYQDSKNNSSRKNLEIFFDAFSFLMFGTWAIKFRALSEISSARLSKVILLITHVSVIVFIFFGTLIEKFQTIGQKI